MKERLFFDKDVLHFVCLPFRIGVEVLFNELEVPEEEYSLGRSKIFIRNPRTVREIIFLTLGKLFE